MPSGGDVMESNNWPRDAASAGELSAGELVVRVVEDIDASDDEHRDVLLSDLRCAAWGSDLAQNQ